MYSESVYFSVEGCFLLSINTLSPVRMSEREYDDVSVGLLALKHTRSGFSMVLYCFELSPDLPGPVSDSHVGRVETLCNDTVPQKLLNLSPLLLLQFPPFFRALIFCSLTGSKRSQLDRPVTREPSLHSDIWWLKFKFFISSINPRSFFQLAPPCLLLAPRFADKTCRPIVAWRSRAE